MCVACHQNVNIQSTLKQGQGTGVAPWHNLRHISQRQLKPGYCVQAAPIQRYSCLQAVILTWCPWHNPIRKAPTCKTCASHSSSSEADVSSPARTTHTTASPLQSNTSSSVYLLFSSKSLLFSCSPCINPCARYYSMRHLNCSFAVISLLTTFKASCL